MEVAMSKTRFAVAALVSTLIVGSTVGGAYAGKGGAGNGISATQAGNKQGPAVRDHRGDSNPPVPVCTSFRCPPGTIRPTSVGPNFGGNARDHR
jgi:hypothetical protein